MNLSFSGIVVTDRAGRIVRETISAGAYSGYCGDPSGWSTPLATLHVGQRVFWILRASVEDGYDYVVVDPTVPDGYVNLKGLWTLRRQH